MKHLLLSLIAGAAALTASAEGADWYFVYDGNSWATNETTQFQTTDTPNVYLLKGYPIENDAAKGGIGFQITNKDWSVYYGWSEGSAGLDVVGSTFPLGSVGNAWLTCEAGSYDITFNAAEKTILFELAAEQPDVPDTGEAWFFVYDGNSWATNADTQLKPTDHPNIFLLANYAIAVPEGADGINFQVTNADWSITYGWSEGSAGIDGVGTAFPMGRVGNCWVTCTSGNYNITFNTSSEEPTILFEDASSGISELQADDNAKTEVFTLSGLRVDNTVSLPGVYIVKKGSKTSKMIVR